MITGSEIAVNFYLLMGLGNLICGGKGSLSRCGPLEYTRACGPLVVFGTQAVSEPSSDPPGYREQETLSIIHFLFYFILF